MSNLDSLFGDGVEAMLRDSMAIQVMNGMCAGDWKFPADNPTAWDLAAATRAYQIADAMLIARQAVKPEAYGDSNGKE